MVSYNKKVYFSVTELAEELDLHQEKVYKILQMPGFPKTKKGRMYLINKKKFYEWKDSYQGTI